jgi:hypothetical protein
MVMMNKQRIKYGNREVKFVRGVVSTPFQEAKELLPSKLKNTRFPSYIVPQLKQEAIRKAIVHKGAILYTIRDYSGPKPIIWGYIITDLKGKLILARDNTIAEKGKQIFDLALKEIPSRR